MTQEATKETARTVLITGGSKGIGKAIAKAFALEGARLAVTYRDAAAAKALRDELPETPLLLLQGDVTSQEDVHRAVAETMATYGRLDVLVNNAGITADGLALRLSAEDFQRVLDVNLTGSFYFMKEAARHMVKQRSGSIISIASVVGLHGNAGQINYAAAKAGVIAMTKTLAQELARRNVRVNAVAPGFIETAMTATLDDKVRESYLQKIPLRRFGSAEDVAQAVCFLASDAARYITGQTLSVDGGMNL